MGASGRIISFVSLWVGGGYFFKLSSIFASPAVMAGRIHTAFFAVIGPTSGGVNICVQIIAGAGIGYGLTQGFYTIHPQQQPQKGNEFYRHARVLELKDF